MLSPASAHRPTTVGPVASDIEAKRLAACARRLSAFWPTTASHITKRHRSRPPRSKCPPPASAHMATSSVGLKRPPRSTRLPLHQPLGQSQVATSPRGIEAAHLAARARPLCQPSSQPQPATSLVVVKPPASQHAPTTCVSPRGYVISRIKAPSSQHTPAACISPPANQRRPCHP